MFCSFEKRRPSYAFIKNMYINISMNVLASILSLCVCSSNGMDIGKILHRTLWAFFKKLPSHLDKSRF